MTDQRSILRDVQVVDRTSGIAGAYCGKVLVDAGARVTRVVGPDDDPLGGLGSEAMFEFLHASKPSVSDGEAEAREAHADIVLTNRATTRATPGQIVVCMTPHGLDGPWVGRPATEFTLQAAGGSTGFRGLPDEEPLAAGGRVGEWMTGTYAALAALAALYHVRRGAEGETIDVAMLDCVAATMAIVPSVYASFLGWLPMSGTGRSIEVPSVEPTADGFVVFTTNSAQQYSDFCVLIGHAELLDDRKLSRPHERFVRREEFEALVRDFTAERTSAEVLTEASLFRIPSGPVLNGETVTGFEQFVERGVYGPSASGRFVQPRVPFRITGEPEPGEPVDRHATDPADDALPLTGVRVVDCTAWWAGPSAAAALAALGADVIKVESITRPDLMRYASTKPPTTDEWWEWSPLFHSGNAGKRAITLDLTRPEGIAVFERLLGTADVLIENYTPRVMDQFGLGWEHAHEVNPDLVMTRMPAFGLDGPWRDNTGFAQTMECISGMAWLTGFADGPPVLVRGACDPLAGMHAVIATLLALLERDNNGGGRLVEATMVEAALNAAAEQVLECSSTGTVQTRDGNRSPQAAPQGVYACAGEDSWLALAIESDEQWIAFKNVLGDPAWAASTGLDTPEGRRAAHDAIDAQLRAWTADASADELADVFCAAGVPAAAVIASRDVVHNPQLRHRGLFETKPHRVTGEHALPMLPFRFSRVTSWLARPAPTLGEHNDEVFAELGLSADEIAGLRSDGIVGERPTGL
jgi:crotonobetainyl-CoA:carnitine CoA-transferase CaiB-like acyl-CoA transferase